MKILLTGITGFFGSHLAAALLLREHEVVGLKRSHSDISRLKDFSDHIKLVDINDGEKSILETHPDIDLIVHTATAYGQSQEELSEIIATNVVMPLRFLEWAAMQPACAFINSDTFFAKASYGYTHLSDYVASKKIFLRLSTDLAEKRGAVFCNMRIEHMFGTRDGDRKFSTSIVRQLLDNVPKIKLTPGKQVRDFVFVDDVVNAYLHVIAAIENRKLSGLSHFEVGSGLPCTVADFVTIAHQIIGSQSRLAFGELPYRENEIMYSAANLDALTALGWRPKVTLERGIELLVASLRQSEVNTHIECNRQ